MRIENYEGSWESYTEECEGSEIDYGVLDCQDDLAYSEDEYDCF